MTTSGKIKQRMGKDRIKRMAATAGLSGEKTNHSARKTMVTGLTKNNMPKLKASINWTQKSSNSQQL